MQKKRKRRLSFANVFSIFEDELMEFLSYVEEAHDTIKNTWNWYKLGTR